ncbi:Hsp20 family protein [Luteithermobacter gelatinilyticus]|uniref:Hsp20 family protein n=1 Tax=Luteithermobacter gelatinilyticus TaxID=2582913 RepID=UPI001FECF988|nr:Hsp20 family protein [Luteithermobacter gelatinilyticus]
MTSPSKSGRKAIPRYSISDNPLLLGFEYLEQRLQQAAKTGSEGCPPFNIETPEPGRLRITLAVAGFCRDNLAVTVENRELMIRGKRQDAEDKTYLHRGIATRQFVRRFVLADGVRVIRASLRHGLLHIDLEEPDPTPERITIEIE